MNNFINHLALYMNIALAQAAAISNTVTLHGERGQR